MKRPPSCWSLKSRFLMILRAWCVFLSSAEASAAIVVQPSTFINQRGRSAEGLGSSQHARMIIVQRSLQSFRAYCTPGQPHLALLAQCRESRCLCRTRSLTAICTPSVPCRMTTSLRSLHDWTQRSRCSLPPSTPSKKRRRFWRRSGVWCADGGLAPHVFTGACLPAREIDLLRWLHSSRKSRDARPIVPTVCCTSGPVSSLPTPAFTPSPPDTRWRSSRETPASRIAR